MKKEEIKLESNIVSNNGVSVKMSCQKTLISEELEASERMEHEDQEKFLSICQDIKNHMKCILTLKTDKPENMAQEVEEIRVTVLMKMMCLRKLSRIQKIRTKCYKENSLDSRQQVDGITLQLQNLLYEVSHLKKEVRRCLEFHSADQDIDLIPIDQFYLEAPETITRPEKTLDNEHEQRLAQLHWELEQRRGQTELFDKLTQEKKAIASFINDQERKLSSLAPRINGILESTRSLQQDIGINLDEQRDQQQIARYLPTPLYNLWVQALAYGEACSKFVKAHIGGDCDAVRKTNIDEDSRTEISDSETELDALEDIELQKPRGRIKKMRPENEEIIDEGMKQLLALHPLHLTLTIIMKDGNQINIQFCYATHLNFVTTKCCVEMANKKTTLLVDALADETILDVLFVADDGRKSPNPSTSYLLTKYGIKSLSADQWKQLGKPYKWAQTICGIKFMETNLILPDTYEGLPRNEMPSSSWQVSAEHMHKNILVIRRRFRARLSLHRQLTALETATSLNDIPLSVDTLHQYFPAKINTDLISWRPITWSDFEAILLTRPYINGDLVNNNWLTFKVIYERKDAVLEAFVAIAPDYPYSSPVFCLSLNWMGLHTSLTDPNLKAMESEVNIYSGEMIVSKEEILMLLSLQLYRLAMCLDIFTEAKCSQLDSLSSENKFHKEKIFFRPARGPERALPFKYLPKLSVFSQR